MCARTLKCKSEETNQFQKLFIPPIKSNCTNFPAHKGKEISTVRFTSHRWMWEAQSHPHLMKTRFIFQGSKNMSRADEESLELIGDKDWQVLTEAWCLQNPPLRLRIRTVGFWGAIVGPENLYPGPLSIKAQGPRQGEKLSRTSSERPNSLEMQLRMTLSSASRGLKGNNDTSSEAASKALPAEKVSRMVLARGYSVGVVQGEDVTSTLNAPTNVLATLMGKDSWTVWLRLFQLTESRGRQLMEQVLE